MFPLLLLVTFLKNMTNTNICLQAACISKHILSSFIRKKIILEFEHKQCKQAGFRYGGNLTPYYGKNQGWGVNSMRSSQVRSYCFNDIPPASWCYFL